MRYGSIDTSTMEAGEPTVPSTRARCWLLVGISGVLLSTVLWYNRHGNVNVSGMASQTSLVLHEDEYHSLQSGNKAKASKSSLSTRGQGIKSVRDDLEAFNTGASDPFHSIDNPEGYLVMLVAENNLMWKEMAAKLTQVQTSSPDDNVNNPLIPKWTLDYGNMGGQTAFKESVAHHVMSKWIQAPVDPDKLRFQAGAGSILSQLSVLLGDDGDGILVTSPMYSAFASDFGMYGHLKLHVAPTKSEHGFVPTRADLEQSYQRATKAGNAPKIFIICQPNNPTGMLYSADAMFLMISWALERGLHVVSDEIYALSVFPGYHTTSAADIMAQRINPGVEKYLGDHVHIVAGMSKDWGMSGFRVGSLFSHNDKLLSAMDIVGYYESVSQYTQNALTRIFMDEKWVEWYIGENQRRLHDTFVALEEAVGLIGVKVEPSHGALFAWADFSAFLKEGQSEQDLWLELYHDAKVLFTTGESCRAGKPGWFRLVYSWPEGAPTAMKELGRRLVKWSTERGK